MKRALIVTLALLLLAALYPTTTVHAEEALTSGDYEYHVLEDGTAEITRYKGSAKSLEIPGKLNGLAVTGIGDRAFDRCSSLKKITIPDSVTSIGDRAFFGCENLTSITIPDSVTNLGYNPFVYCNNLNRVTAQPDHPVLATIDGVLFNKADKRLIWYPMPREDTVYEIPQGIQSIGDSAFAGCKNLTSISIPDSVTSIGNLAFYWCSSLKEITIPDSVTSIGDGAFVLCSSLKEITIPDSVTSIGEMAFYRCSSLKEITIPDSVTSIGDLAFYMCSSLQKAIVTPDSYAQQYCEKHCLPFVYQENANQMND